MYRDPVCQRELFEDDVVETSEHEGEIYRFCCSGCKEKFTANPDPYLNPGWWRRLLSWIGESNEKQFGKSGPRCH